jgi:hypothetical protein
MSARRVLVTEYVEGVPAEEIRGDAERDRVGEIAFRFFFDLPWRAGIVAGEPHADNCVLCPDGRLCVLDFGLLRELEPDYIEGERAIMRAIAEGDPQGVHDGLAELGYLREPQDAGALLELLASAGEWLLAPGARRIDPGYVLATLERGYPPRSPHFAAMRHMRIPPATLLLRRLEIQVLALLGDLRAGGDWGAIAAEHHSDRPPSTAVGEAFAARR